MIKTKEDVVLRDRPKRVAQKTRTASPSPKSGASGGKGPPVAVASSAGPGGGSLLIRGVSDGLLKRLELARAKQGLRSRNDAVLAILDEGAPK
ncbi:MAG: hypothetical protein WCJ96_11250 [Verrucomicrobiota bacterium]